MALTDLVNPSVDTLIKQIVAEFPDSSESSTISGAWTFTGDPLFRGALTTTDVASVRVTGDTDDRITVNAGGTLEWGAGSGAVDTNLYRSAANTLKTDDALTVTGALTTNNDAVARSGTGYAVLIGQAGPSSEAGIKFGTGYDTNLYRSAADTLKTDDALTVTGVLSTAGGLRMTGSTNYLELSVASSGTNTFMRSFVSGDSQPRLAVTAGGSISWGAGGASVADVNLYRSAANTISTDYNFSVLGGSSKIALGSSGARVQFGHADHFQTTVGAAGGGSALPATPTKYVKVLDNSGATFVIPCYAAS